MKIAQVYSHLNGLEFMLVRKPGLWQEIQDAVRNVDASSKGWQEVRHAYFVNEDLNTAREIVHILDQDEQKRVILAHGFTPYRTYNQIDFVKDRAAVYENELANIVREGREVTPGLFLCDIIKKTYPTLRNQNE